MIDPEIARLQAEEFVKYLEERNIKLADLKHEFKLKLTDLFAYWEASGYRKGYRAGDTNP